MFSKDSTKHPLDKVVDPAKSPIENLLKVFQTDRELFFSLHELLPGNLSSAGKQVVELSEELRTGLQLGYSVTEDGDVAHLLVFDPNARHVVSVSKSLLLPLREMLSDLNGPANVSAKGKDYVGKPISKAEFDFRHRPVAAWNSIAREIEEREHTRPELLRLDEEEAEDLKHKPKYVLDELLNFGRATVFSPTCVFKGIRETGKLKRKGYAFCAKPESEVANDDLVFTVFADDDGYVFDWGWVEQDDSMRGFPREFQTRFKQPLATKSHARLVGTDHLEHVSFHPVTAVHSTRGDCILFYFNDSPSFMRRINDDLTILVDRVNNRKMNGFKLKNVSRILSKMFGDPETATQLGINVDEVQAAASSNPYVELSIAHTLVCSQNEQWPNGASSYIEVQTALVEQKVCSHATEAPKVKVRSVEKIAALLSS